MKIAIWGAGEGCRNYIEMKSNVDIQVVLIVDSSPKLWGVEMCGYEVGAPLKLKQVEWDRIFISPYSQDTRNEIIKLLKHEYGVGDEKIIGRYELITGRKEAFVPRKVYDCFTFFNELDLLEMRLKLLNPIVDYFVIVEMEKNFRGKIKPFYFEANKERYKEYLDKIVHVKIENEKIPNSGEIMRTNWKGIVNDFTLEVFQRNCIEQGIKESNSEDIILVSDVDEIPNPKLLREIRNESRNINYLPQLLELGPIVLKNDFYMGYINCKVDAEWLGTVVTLRKYVQKPDEIRSFRTMFPKLERGGWHLSWMGASRESILRKQLALSEGTEHTEESLERLVSDILAGKAMPTNEACGEIIPLEKIDFPFARELYQCEREKWFIETN